MFTTPFSGSSLQIKWKKKSVICSFLWGNGISEDCSKQLKQSHWHSLRKISLWFPNTPDSPKTTSGLHSVQCPSANNSTWSHKIPAQNQSPEWPPPATWSTSLAKPPSSAKLELQWGGGRTDLSFPGKAHPFPNPGVSWFPSQLKVISLSPVWQ